MTSKFTSAFTNGTVDIAAPREPFVPDVIISDALRQPKKYPSPLAPGAVRAAIDTLYFLWTIETFITK